MPMPKSVTKTTKDGVVFIDNCDAVNYTIRELTRAALRDVGKFVVRQMNQKAQKLKGMKKNGRVRGRNSAFQYWNRARECDLQVGVKHGTWYGEHQELGTSKMKKHGIIKASVYDNIPTIIEIESQYLSALRSEAEALALIDESDQQGGEDG